MNDRQNERWSSRSGWHVPELAKGVARPGNHALRSKLRDVPPSPRNCAVILAQSLTCCLLFSTGCASVPWPFTSWTHAGSEQSAAKSSAAAPKSSGAAANADSLKEVMAELQEAGAIDPAAREELIADLKQTDPSRWPLVMQEFPRPLPIAGGSRRGRRKSKRSNRPKWRVFIIRYTAMIVGAASRRLKQRGGTPRPRPRTATIT